MIPLLAALALTAAQPGCGTPSDVVLLPEVPLPAVAPVVADGYLCSADGRRFAIVRLANRTANPLFLAAGSALVSARVRAHPIANDQLLDLHADQCATQNLRLLPAYSTTYLTFPILGDPHEPISLTVAWNVTAQPICEKSGTGFWKSVLVAAPATIPKESQP